MVNYGQYDRLKQLSDVRAVDSNPETDSYTRLSEDEAWLQLEDLEILLLPYKEAILTTGNMLK
ncbi:hypothetical protein H5410_023777 [Solanum commersonii]|uniref:Uncharacterized protein n=1 Tax=Solanum commersonii TaxID=4109 RepID=A0A9J5ZJR2_SOLCO|nr:hypothetical protein H5410_023777 [Solanum commersonii]